MDGLSASLDHIQLRSGGPDRLAAFYGETLGMPPERAGPDGWLCAGPRRRVLIARGAPRSLGFSAYRFDSPAGLAAMRDRLRRHGIAPEASPSPLFGPDAFAAADPDGNLFVFGYESAADGSRTPPPPAGQTLRGRLQHVALASDHPERLLTFYTEIFGCTLSDQVRSDGSVAACWLRTDREHHTVAVFRTREPGRRLDHHSYEVEEWALIRDWADHFASRGIPLAWGPGRHGPGNNLFIMIRDPDDNLVEFSAELEVMTRGRPPGVWPPAESTFNKWGSAPIRS